MMEVNEGDLSICGHTDTQAFTYCVCVCYKDGELKDSRTIHRVPEKGISEKKRPGWARGGLDETKG